MNIASGIFYGLIKATGNFPAAIPPILVLAILVLLTALLSKTAFEKEVLCKVNALPPVKERLGFAASKKTETGGMYSQQSDAPYKRPSWMDPLPEKEEEQPLVVNKKKEEKPANHLLNAQEREKEIAEHRTIYSKGVISKEEFEKRVAEINSRTDPSVLPPEVKEQIPSIEDELSEIEAFGQKKKEVKVHNRPNWMDPIPEEKEHLLTAEEREREIAVHRSIYSKGVISKEELEERIAEVNSRSDPSALPEDEQGFRLASKLRKLPGANGPKPNYGYDRPSWMEPKPTPPPIPEKKNPLLAEEKGHLLTAEEREKEIAIHRTIYSKGVISKEEFEKRVAEIDSRTDPSVLNKK